jgi:hypothetical protein
MAKPLLYIAAAITVGVSLIQSALRGSAPDTVSEALSPIGIAVTITGILWWLFDRWLWRPRVARKMHGRPLLDGTWHGTLASTHLWPDGSRVEPDDDVYLVVRQRFSTLTISLHTSESSSRSMATVLETGPDGKGLIGHLYDNVPKPDVVERSPKHTGGSILHPPAKDGAPLTGSYFTDRKTTGQLTFHTRRRGHANSHAEATQTFAAPVPPAWPRRALAAPKRSIARRKDTAPPT